MDEYDVARGIQRQKEAESGARLTGCLGCLGTVIVLALIAAAAGLGGSFAVGVAIVLIGLAVSGVLYRRSLNKALGRP